MPIARFEVRNEYGLGQPELYRDVDREDPKAVLDGVAVSGLVGILRQLGDLSEFAAEIFHGIQEEVMTTASRSNILMNRLRHIEATVPALGKTMLAQASHLHFAYTEGHKWHTRILETQNHFICDDLPRVIMNSYEECRDPPRLHFLDKFDIDGPGSCLKRYSDPTFFRRASVKPVEVNSDFQKHNKKKKKPLQRNRDLSRLANQSGGQPFASFSFAGRTSSSKTVSTIDTELKSDLRDDDTRSFDSRYGSGYIEQRLSSSLKTEEKPPGEVSSSSLTPGALTIASVLTEIHSEDTDDDFAYSPVQEKGEMYISNCPQVSVDEAPEGDDDVEGVESVSSLKQYAEIEAEEDMKAGRETEKERRELKMEVEHETESEGDTFVDALNIIESESETDLPTVRDAQTNSNGERLETSKGGHEFARTCSIDRESEQNLDNVDDGNDQTACVLSDLPADKRICGGTGTFSSANASDELISRDSRMGSNVYNESEGDYDINFSGSCNNITQEHQEAEAEACNNVRPVTIWTNGSLLGLKPSKPPVFGVPKAEEPEKEQSDIAVRNAPQFRMAPSNASEKSSRLFTDPFANDEKSCDSNRAHAYTSADSRDVGLSRKLTVNGSRRKDSFTRGRTILPATIPEKSEFSGRDSEGEAFGDDSPVGWLSSSPPLEHMKISFNPTESLHSSKLKLKFPDGVRLHEGNGYSFSSFQLVPDPATSSVLDFDSDYDTFCRSSSPHMSDNDYPSDNDSVSSSKQWEEESSDISETKGHELYDSLHRSTHTKPDDDEPASPSVQLLNIPGFEALNPSLQSEPSPPPLPPLQWRISKPSTERIELKHGFDEEGHASTGSRLSSTDPFYKEKPSIVPVAPKPENNVRQKNNGREDEQNGNVKETEAEDLLHQIRTKQFSLRSVATTTQPSASSRTAINAILEKASSIRQAVASDDEDESDTWSDT